ncbi:DUF1841 family protein [Thiolinea disciformis]|uniref:DUF1841 family protein n=1 Tax=Thiolinea disciformis TaxID=125614 RepID=UPI000377CDAB|nr:DUF1841 family protein [Thiolinea disciformis]
MFGNDRDSLRRYYQQCWQKKQTNQPMDALEQQIAQVISEHPEYQAFITQERSVGRNFLPEMGETNPFLHLGLHLGLREQIATDRPTGIRAIYQKLLTLKDLHTTEHEMMECLAESIWQAQRDNTMPDEQRYLQKLMNLLP